MMSLENEIKNIGVLRFLNISEKVITNESRRKQH